jgi:hypothetical protein
MIRFSVDPRTRTRTARYSGVITEEELLTTYATLVADPGYDPTFDDLVDLREVERLELSAAAIRQLATMFVPLDAVSGHTRTAIVAASDAVFGMSRMYEMLRGDEVPEEIRVFRSYEEATAWLADRPARQ